MAHINLHNVTYSSILMITEAFGAISIEHNHMDWLTHIHRLEMTEHTQEDFYIDFTAMVGNKGDIKVEGRIFFPNICDKPGNRFACGNLVAIVTGYGGYKIYLVDRRYEHGYPIHQELHLEPYLPKLFLSLKDAIPNVLAQAGLMDMYLLDVARDEVFRPDGERSQVPCLTALSDEDYENVLTFLEYIEKCSMGLECKWLQKNERGKTKPHTFGDLDTMLEALRFNPTGIDPSMEICHGRLITAIKHTNAHILDVVGTTGRSA